MMHLRSVVGLLIVLSCASATVGSRGAASDELRDRVDALQEELKICGPAALSFCLRQLGHDVSAASVVKRTSSDSRGVPLVEILKIARVYEKSAEAVKFAPAMLERVSTPTILVFEDVHCVVYCGEAAEQGQIKIFDPQIDRIGTVPTAVIAGMWDGKAVVFRRRHRWLWRWGIGVALLCLAALLACWARWIPAPGRASWLRSSYEKKPDVARDTGPC